MVLTYCINLNAVVECYYGANTKEVNMNSFCSEIFVFESLC